MKLELDVLADSVKPAILPSDLTANEEVRTMLRRQLNLASIAAVNDGALSGDLHEIAKSLTKLMMMNARALIVLNKTPDAETFRHASAQLLTETRVSTDLTLRNNKLEDIAICAVMQEIVIRGVFACLNIPYEEGLADATKEL